MLSLQVKCSADRHTDRRTPVNQYGPDLSMLRHKKEEKGVAVHDVAFSSLYYPKGAYIVALLSVRPPVLSHFSATPGPNWIKLHV